jgi:hypothetical protein
MSAGLAIARGSRGGWVLAVHVATRLLEGSIQPVSSLAPVGIKALVSLEDEAPQERRHDGMEGPAGAMSR